MEFPRCLAANPHYYDYMHYMFFDEDKIEMGDGGGQSMNFEAIGRYSVKFENDSNGILSIDMDDYEPMDVKFEIEKGPFRLEGSFNTVCVAEERYIFERDPMDIGLETRKNNLMFLLNCYS